MAPDPLRSKLSRVKGLGPAHHGVSHWWMQRLTAIALVPLSFWLISSILRTMLASDVFTVVQFFASPIHALMTALLIVAMFLHARLGVQVIVEDYVKCAYKKYGVLIFNNFACIGLAALAVLSILRLHMLS